MNRAQSTMWEQIPPDECDQIKEITELTVALLNQRYPGNLQRRRNVHPKDHGCVKATFEVDACLPASLHVGIFSQPGRQYDAWIRFSNCTAAVGSDVSLKANGDRKHESRGMAIKLMGVQGDVIDKEAGAATQDFLMISEPAFAIANVADYLKLTQIQLADKDNPLRFFAPLQNPSSGLTPEELARLKRSFQIVQSFKAVGSPLEIQYFSAAPFRFGPDQVMKFSAKPSEIPTTQIPDHPSENYLREAMINHLCGKPPMVPGKPAHFDFMIQAPTQRDDLGIEDATFEWKESLAGFDFKKVARITIPPKNSIRRKDEQSVKASSFPPGIRLRLMNRLAESIAFEGPSTSRLQSIVTSPKSLWGIKHEIPNPDWVTLLKVVEGEEWHSALGQQGKQGQQRKPPRLLPGLNP